MTRAPKFVVVAAGGCVVGLFDTEQEARANSIASGTIHPIGAALPAKVAEKTLGQVASDAYDHHGPFDGRWSRVASAVVAAHEARKVTERVVRWAVRRGDQWATGINWGAKEFRTLYATRDCAAYGRLSRDEKIVRITTRRRVRAK